MPCSDHVGAVHAVHAGTAQCTLVLLIAPWCSHLTVNYSYRVTTLDTQPYNFCFTDVTFMSLTFTALTNSLTDFQLSTWCK